MVAGGATALSVLMETKRFGGSLDVLVGEAKDAGFEPLVEVHTHEELEDALDTDARVIGVNSRDLKRLKVDLSHAESLLPHVPDDRLAVAENR